jgi:hypothetical protein
MSRASEISQMSLFPNTPNNQTTYIRALTAKARRLQGYWFQNMRCQIAPMPAFAFFVDLSRRYSEHDARHAIQLTVQKMLKSKVGPEQAEQGCWSAARALVLRRVKQKIAFTEKKRPAASVSSTARCKAFRWLQ